MCLVCMLWKQVILLLISDLFKRFDRNITPQLYKENKQFSVMINQLKFVYTCTYLCSK